MNKIERTQLINKYNEWIITVDEVENKIKLWLIASFPKIVDEAFPKKKSIFSMLGDKKNGSQN
jgi:hypothetical protein